MKEVKFPSIPSLTLKPSGVDRLTVNRHFPVRFDSEITTKGLIWTYGSACSGSGPAMWPFKHSFSRYSCTTWGLSRGELVLLLEEILVAVYG